MVAIETYSFDTQPVSTATFSQYSYKLNAQTMWVCMTLACESKAKEVNDLHFQILMHIPITFSRFFLWLAEWKERVKELREEE